MASRIAYNNPDELGALGLPYHHEMVSDPQRVKPFKEAIEKTAKDKIVLESGTGTGIMSLLAARTGAKHVYAVEIDPVVARVAQQNIQRSNYKNITLIQKSIWDLTVADLNGEQADLVIAENLSTWQVTEPQIQIMNHINANLAKADAIRLPQQVANHAQLVHANFWFEDLVYLPTHFFEFSGIQKAEPITPIQEFSTFDYRQRNPTAFAGTLQLRASQSGIANAVRLTSPVVVHQDITFQSSDSLMPPVVVPLAKERFLEAGEEVTLSLQYQSLTNWETFRPLLQ